MGTSRVAVYGLGRAGRALTRAAQRAGLELGPLWNRGEARAENAAASLGLPTHHGLVPPSADGAQLVFLAVADRAIEGLAATLADLGALVARPVVAHLAGALDLTALTAASAIGCATGSLHPARALLGQETPLRGALCVIDGDGPARAALEDFAALLGCVGAHVPGPARALYHAATAIAANDTAALIDLSAGTLRAAGIPRELATRAALDLARGALENIERVGPAAALTGPVARGDAEILARHLRALGQETPELAEIHRLLSRALLDLARAQGTPEERLESIAQLLATPGPG